MDTRSPAFERTYEDYLEQVARLDLASRGERLGIEVRDGTALVPLIGETHRVGAGGVAGPGGERPLHSVSVLLCRYLIACPDEMPSGSDWVAYRDFPDAAPFVGGFATNAERPVARRFAGRASDLRSACEKLDAGAPDRELSHDLAARFTCLPRVPILLLFNDADEEFPAQCTMLFERRAEHWLDMECLAILGWHLPDRLSEVAGDEVRTIM